MSFSLSDPTLQRIIKSAVDFLVVYLSAFGLSRLISSLKISNRKKHRYRKIIYYVATIIGFAILATIWSGTTKSLTTIIGVASAGVAIALQQVLLNIAGWFFIIIRRPYDIGDRVEIGGVQGDVIDISLFQSSLLEIGNWVEADQSTGRIVHCPHSLIFKEPLFNYTKGFEFIWNEIKILLTFESDWKKGKEVILDSVSKERQQLEGVMKEKLKRMSRKYLIHYTKFTPIVYTRIAESGVELTLRYLVDTKERRSSQHRICEEILEALEKEEDIELAYPTYRIYQRDKNS